MTKTIRTMTGAMALLALLAGAVSAEQTPVVHVIEIDAAIHPVTMRFIENSIVRAEQEGAEAIVIQLDTPGGLMESSRGITKAILNSRVPVIVHVWPDGARAGSAGVFITMASHVAAMAPSTNIGAATPVGMGGGGAQPDSGSGGDAEAMRKKVTNDAIAQVRAMAELRGRNGDWAEKAITEAASITASEALELNVIDLIVPELDQLLDEIDGWKVTTGDEKEVTLATAGAEVLHFEMDWRERFLNTIANPNLAYILLLLGFYGLIFELYNPGAVIPGVIGVISLIIAFFAMQTLPLDWAGLLLIAAGVVMLILEIYVVSYGFLTLGGAVGLAVGGIMLFDTDIPSMQVSLGVIIPTVLITIAFFAFALTWGIRAQGRKVTTGSEGLVGEEGVAFEQLSPTGRVRVGGEYWKAEAVGGSIEKDTPVVVVEHQRLRLKVRAKG